MKNFLFFLFFTVLLIHIPHLESISQTPSDTLEKIYLSSDSSKFLYLPPPGEESSSPSETSVEKVTSEDIKTSPGEIDKTVNPILKEKSRINFILGKGEFHQTPFYIIEGNQEGSVMIIHGGMHGDERASFLALDRILENLSILKGKLIIIPRINRPASEQQNRWYNNDPSRDFNHYFPGRNFSSRQSLMSNYEYRLANQFMDLINEHKPDVVVNLHEDKDKFFKIPGVDTVYNDIENLGQTIYTAERPISKELLNIVRRLNGKIKENEYQFTANSVLDYDSKQRGNLLEYLVDEVSFEGKKVRSYTLETYRNEYVRGMPPVFSSGFTLEDRIKLQMNVILAFLEEFGLKYRYKGGEEAIKYLTRLTPFH
jgi:hypothetical protein